MKQEAELQKAIVQWFRLQYPKTLIYHIPNGGGRSIVTAMYLKKIGAKSGVPDLCICKKNSMFGALYIECKRDEKQKLSVNQKEVSEWLIESGYQFASFFDYNEAIRFISDYMKIK